MKTLGNQTLFSYLSDRAGIQSVTNTKVRADRGVRVGSFPELVERLAQLSFYNPDFLLFYRGQEQDWRNRAGNTSIKPSLFRPESGRSVTPPAGELVRRYERLQQAEELLVTSLAARRLPGLTRLRRYRILRWAILQHYEICATPLLDVTHSLRVAATFASQSERKETFLCVLALPSLAGSVTTSSEQGVQVIRLLSICPPDALRPYYQEGYLLGEYPELSTVREKGNYEAYEIDFGLRLIGKFRIRPKEFWKKDARFAAIPSRALFPDDRDPLFRIAKEIRRELSDAGRGGPRSARGPATAGGVDRAVGLNSSSPR